MAVPKQILEKRIPFKLINGQSVLLKPLGRADYDALNQWVKKQYMENVGDAVRSLDSAEQQAFMLAALSHASKLTFQFGDGREILMESAYGLSRLAYQLIESPGMSFSDFNAMLFPDTFINIEGISCVTDMIELTYQHVEEAVLDEESRFIKKRISDAKKAAKASNKKPVKTAKKTKKTTK